MKLEDKVIIGLGVSVVGCFGLIAACIKFEAKKDKMYHDREMARIQANREILTAAPKAAEKSATEVG